MSFINLKTTLSLAWVVVVALAAFLTGVTSAVNWAVVACVAVIPPLVVRQFWHAPERTMSENIHDARR